MPSSRHKTKSSVKAPATAPRPEKPQAPLTDMRNYPRAPLIALVTVEGFGVFKSIDISENGILLKVGKTTIPQGTFVKLTVESKIFEKPLELTGVAIRTSEAHEKNKGLGIHLVRINPVHRRTIKAYIQAYFFTNR